MACRVRLPESQPAIKRMNASKHANDASLQATNNLGSNCNLSFAAGLIFFSVKTYVQLIDFIRLGS